MDQRRFGHDGYDCGEVKLAPDCAPLVQATLLLIKRSLNRRGSWNYSAPHLSLRVTWIRHAKTGFPDILRLE